MGISLPKLRDSVIFYLELPLSVTPLDFHDCGLTINLLFPLHISESSIFYSSNSFCDSLSFPLSGQTNILEFYGVSVNQEGFLSLLAKLLSSRLPVPKCHRLRKIALFLENSIIKCALKSPFLGWFYPQHSEYPTSSVDWSSQCKFVEQRIRYL